MGASLTEFKAKRRRRFYFLFFGFCLLPFAFASAHEPITTKVRFNKEVIRILQGSCLGCHRPGGIAMSLATYEEARPWAKAIKEEMLEKRMPPWRAVKGFGEFNNAPALTQREIDLIVNWIEGGAPKGDDKDLPPGPLYSDDWKLGKPDLTLKIGPEQRVAADADEHRTVVLPTGLKEDRWLTAIDLRPGNAAVLHCASVHIESPPDSFNSRSEVPDQTSATSSRGKRPAPGTALTNWMPGQTVVALPADVGRLLQAGSRLIVSIHYRGAGEETKDSSSKLGLYFTRTPPRKQVADLLITDPSAVIPAGQVHKITSSMTFQEDVEAVAIRPRSQPLMVSFQATAYRTDGSEEVLIWTTGYHFDWQHTYSFKRPAVLPKGTRIEVAAYFDNTEENQHNPNSPPRQVTWSQLSPEPLCTLVIARERNGAERAATGY